MEAVNQLHAGINHVTSEQPQPWGRYFSYFCQSCWARDWAERVPMLVASFMESDTI